MTQIRTSATAAIAALVLGVAGASGSVVDVTATHSDDAHLFLLSTTEVASGWTTFRFTNASPSDHFVLLFRAPQEAIDAATSAGVSLLEHWHEVVTVPFQEEFDRYVAGDVTYEEFVDALVGAIVESAPWFFDPGAPPVGGPGLTAAGRASETTVLLEPGTYILECYVKDSDEEFHSYNGMLEMLSVAEAKSDAREPEATAELLLSSGEGIRVPQDVQAGMQTIAIRFLDQTAYEHLQGHNAHLVRVSGTEPHLLDALADWMDWRVRGSLASRAPAGVEFLGGTMEMAAGGTAYFSVDLAPGTYAWIAEVPDPAGKNMLTTFTVPPAPEAGQ